MAATRRVAVMVSSIPTLPRGVRLKFDSVRNMHVLLGPERALMLDDTGHAVLSEVDGNRTVQDIATILAKKYQAPVEMIKADIRGFLKDLADKRLIDLRTP